MKGIQQQLSVLGVICGVLCFAFVSVAQETTPLPAHTSWIMVAQAYDEPPPSGGIQGFDVGAGHINWSKLNLSSEQKSLFLEKRREFQIATAGVRKELEFLEQDLRRTISNKSIDRAEIEVLLEKIGSLKHRLSEAAIQNLLDMKAVLTPEQVKKLAALQVKLPREFQSLELTDEQQGTIWRILTTSFRSNGQASARIRFLRAELQDLLLFSQDIDQARIAEVQQTITDEELKLEKARIDTMLQVHDVLTPEQREHYQKIRLRQPPERENPSAQDKPKR